MIPSILHQIWIGPNIPTEMVARMEQMRRANPAFKYMMHRDEVLERYKGDPYITAANRSGQALAFIVDRIRVLILRDFGGIYVDSDAKPVKSFTAIQSILEDPTTDFICGMRSPDRPGVRLNGGISFIDNTVMASVPNGRMVNRLCELWHPNSKIQNGHNIGLQIARHSDAGTRILNYRYFYAETPFPESIILHDSINLSSWAQTKPIGAAA